LTRLGLSVRAVTGRKPGSGPSGTGALVVALVTATFIMSCASGGGKKGCAKPREYQASDSREPLKVPDNLDEPDRSARLIVPEARAEDTESDAEQPCLDQPPDYFDRKL
jgi:hypothetical protein